VAVGAREDDTTAGGPDAGSAYIFTRSGSVWTERQKLAQSDPFNGDRLGGSIALSFGNLVVVCSGESSHLAEWTRAIYYFTSVGPATLFDYDGDHLADISIFRPSNGQWWYQQSSDNTVRALAFGTPTDKPVPADYDGDGKTDIAIYRPSTGEWFVLRSSNLSFLFSLPFGISTDKPSPGDFDGDGMADITVFRSSEGTWYINKTIGRNSDNAVWEPPVIFRKTATMTLTAKAMSRSSVHRMDRGGSIDRGRFLRQQHSASARINQFPRITRATVRLDIAVWRPATGSWYILRSEDSSFFAIPFGRDPRSSSRPLILTETAKPTSPSSGRIGGELVHPTCRLTGY
jgi:hypothetical protein